MKKFLYLYPIKEFTNMFLFEREFYEKQGRRYSLDVLNEAINKRYREKGYDVVFALYPDREIYGLDLEENDKIIYTDITFSEASGYYPDGSEKPKSEIKYPSEEYLIEQLGDVDKLVVGGYHFSDCVLKVAEKAYFLGIDTLEDVELTDIFFGLYYQEYFRVDDYSPERYKEYRRSFDEQLGIPDSLFEQNFGRIYQSPVFGFKNKVRVKE